MQEKEPPVLISFFGPTGAGKTTARSMAADILRRMGFMAIGLDVARSLRAAQVGVYDSLGLESPGYEDDDGFTQDPELMSFLVDRYGDAVIKKFRQMHDLWLLRCGGEFSRKRLALLNADCRNNAYETLKGLGYRFVYVATPRAMRSIRLSDRGDVSVPEDDEASTSTIVPDEMLNNSGSFEQLERNVEELMIRLLR